MNRGNDKRSIVPRTATNLAAAQGRLPARVQPQAAFSPGELGYDYKHGGRDEAWRLISPATQDRLRARVGGEIIDWWARQDKSGRISATVLGPGGLALAVPITKDDGRKASRIDTTRFVPDSLRVVDVTGDVRPVAGRASSGETHGVPKLAGVLTPSMQGFIGNLTPRIQSLLQEPFRPEPGLAYDFSYELTSELNTTIWWFGCYMSDGRTLTFASGTRTSKRGQPEGSGHWDAACHRASVIAPR